MKGILTRDMEVLRTGGWIMPCLTFVFFMINEMVLQTVGIMWGMYFILWMVLPDEQMPFALCLPWERWHLVASRFVWVAANALLTIPSGLLSLLAFQELEALLVCVFGFAALLFGGSLVMLLSFCIPRKGKIIATVAMMGIYITWLVRIVSRQGLQWTITGARLGWMVLGSIVFAAVAFGISVLAIRHTEV